MKRWWNRLKISHKIILGFLGLIALPLSLLLTFNFFSFTAQYEQRLTQSGRDMLGIVVQDINEKLDHVEMLVQVLASNRRLVSFLSRDYEGAASYEEYTQTVLPLLEGAGNTVTPSIERILLLTDNGTIPEGYGMVYHMDAAPESIPESLLDGGSADVWYVTEEDGAQVLYYICPVLSSPRKSEGYILARMLGEKLFSEIRMLQEGETALFLLDAENRPVFSNVQTDADFHFSEETAAQGTVRYFSAPLERLPLRVGVALPAGENGILQRNSLLTLVLMGLLSFLFLSLFYSLLRSVIARLRRYGDDMERIAADDFNGALAIEWLDEIGIIGQQFNRVLERMHALMQENIRKETAYEDAQLKALLLQINPHFIYNTLDMFAGKLTLDGEYELADTMCDFAQMIRYNTVASGTSLPLRDELEHVRNYVSLQRCRYGARVVLRIHAAESLLGVSIPRFLLQPIVENAFEHGFAGRAPDAERCIVVSAKRLGKRLILRVWDNGQGMEPEQVAEMNRKFALPYDALALRHEEKRGIGLENINDRLRIFARADDRLVLRSRRGRYTSVFVLLEL